MTTVATSYWPADTSEPVLETTVGGILRAAADAGPDPTAWWRRSRPGPAQALDLRRAAGRRRAGGAGAEHPLRARRAGRRVGTEPARMGHPRVRRRSGRAGPGHRQPGLPAGRAGLRTEPVRRGRHLPGSGVPQPDGQFLDEVRPDLPGLREVVYLTDWAEFLATAPAQAALPDVRPDDIAQIQYTSGTTGFPKGACCTTGA